jgi:hypothetical protein
MILNELQRHEFEQAARPLIKWLNDNCHPHVTAIIEPTRAELDVRVDEDGCCATCGCTATAPGAEAAIHYAAEGVIGRAKIADLRALCREAATALHNKADHALVIASECPDCHLIGRLRAAAGGT